ncbi:MAG: hypothetical protein AAFP70_18440 [Calditrichota bacterium]
MYKRAIQFTCLQILVSWTFVSGQPVTVETYPTPKAYHLAMAAKGEPADKFIFYQKINKKDNQTFFFNSGGSLTRTLETQRFQKEGKPYTQYVYDYDSYAIVITKDYSIEREGNAPVSTLSQIYSTEGEELGSVLNEFQALKPFSDSLVILADNSFEYAWEKSSLYTLNGSLVKEMPEVDFHYLLAKRDDLFLCAANGRLVRMTPTADMIWELPLSAQRNTLTISYDLRICFAGVRKAFVFNAGGEEVATLNFSDKSGTSRAAIDRSGKYVIWAFNRVVRHESTVDTVLNWQKVTLGLTDLTSGRNLWINSLPETVDRTDDGFAHQVGFFGKNNGFFIRWHTEIAFYSPTGEELLREPIDFVTYEKIFQYGNRLMLYNRRTGVVRIVKATN